MRILIVTQYFWPENFRINDLALALVDKGHEVTVLTGLPNYPSGRIFDGYGWFRPGREGYHGVDVMRVPLVPRGRGGGVNLAVNYGSFAFFASLLAPVRCRDDYDIIFVFEPSPITVCLPALVLKGLKKVPLILWVQDLWPESLSATGAVKSPRILKWVERLVSFIYRHCDLILAQSRAFLPAIKQRGAPDDRVAYFPNSAEALYRPVLIEQDAPEEAHLPLGFRLMFAGNIGAAQDFSTILAAAERLKAYPDIHWVILGDGRLAPWVREEVERRDLRANVHLLGQHPAESMPRYFQLADALLVTLKKDFIFSLTIPSKIQSYLACGRPIVAGLDGEGARIVEESGAGYYAPAEDPGALAEAVLRMYKHTDAERADMGRRARAYFEAHFERTMLVERLDAWMNSLVRRNRICVS